MNTRRILLSNASATGAGVDWPGGPCSFALTGTVGGATVTLQILGPDDTTWLTAASTMVLTAVGVGYARIPRGTIRALVASGSPSGLYATASSVS